MAQMEYQRKIEVARLNKSTELDLAQMKLDEIPRELNRLPHVKRLYLNSNNSKNPPSKKVVLAEAPKGP